MIYKMIFKINIEKNYTNKNLELIKHYKWYFHFVLLHAHTHTHIMILKY